MANDRIPRRPFEVFTHDSGGGHVYWTCLDAEGFLMAQGRREYIDNVLLTPTPNDDLFSYPAMKSLPGMTPIGDWVSRKD